MPSASGVMLSLTVLNVVVLSVVAPEKRPGKRHFSLFSLHVSDKKVYKINTWPIFWNAKIVQMSSRIESGTLVVLLIGIILIV